MIKSQLSVLVALLVALTCSVYSDETAHETGMQSADYSTSNSEHHAQKRMAPNSPSEDEAELLLRDESLEDIPAQEDLVDKRGSLFRFGKRQGSLLRFGKRGSLFRFGKRQGGTLFRFGKRGGTLFRFGRSGPAENSFDGLKESDIEFLRNLYGLSEYGYSPLNQDGAASKRGIDSFHWGSDSDK
uniref:LFRFamide-1 n=1 Tax=Ambigolimax valentianus TaxID=1338344 RepID=A0A2Z6C494_9EUPU|nr:LFRFamide-1 [Ambigolimax valentianus]